MVFVYLSLAVASAALAWLAMRCDGLSSRLADQAGLADLFERQRDEWHESWSQERKQREEAEQKCSELEEAVAAWERVAQQCQELAKNESYERIAADEKCSKLKKKCEDLEEALASRRSEVLRLQNLAKNESYERMWHDRLINSISSEIEIENCYMDNPRNTAMIRRNGGKIVRFADLPVVCQNAMIHYMSVDGAAWAVESRDRMSRIRGENWADWKWGEGTPHKSKQRREMLADIEKFRHRFIERWGDEKFGLVEVPTKELLDAIREDDEFCSDDRYEKETTPGFDDDWEYDLPTWPVILSDFPAETLQDGWTRFHRYCQLGVEKILCLFYINLQ